MLNHRRLAAALAGAGAMAALGFSATWAAGGGSSPTDHARGALDGKRPKNVIFLLGDGMGIAEVTTARYYEYGAAGRMNFDRFPFTGFDNTWSLTPGEGTPYKPDHTPDSAATGTEWATGKKTIDERVSQGPSSAVDVPGDNDAYGTVLEIAQEQGKKTGNVSTAEITDATPAVLAAHISDRGCQGPEDTAKTCPTETKAAGGLGSIAEQEVDHGIDVILGGAARFAQKTDAGPTVLDDAADAGYEIVTDAAGLAAFSDDDTPLLGLSPTGT